MSYRDRLQPWCIIRLLPQMQRITVHRFRRRNDAEAHLRVLRQLEPGEYAIVFEMPPQSQVEVAEAHHSVERS